MRGFHLHLRQVHREPFEAGYGHTIGNSLRRVLLSSIEGSAISSIKIEGVNHEFQSSTASSRT
ncbi:MAG: hypothetical protein WDM96_16500 [Lacunisphaera sp.]